jgi:hypothetical protein
MTLFFIKLPGNYAAPAGRKPGQVSKLRDGWVRHCPRRLSTATKGCRTHLITSRGVLWPAQDPAVRALLGCRPVCDRAVFHRHIVGFCRRWCCRAGGRCGGSLGFCWACMSSGFANRVMKWYLLLLLTMPYACSGCRRRIWGSLWFLGGGKYWILLLRSREFLSSYSSVSIVSIFLHTLLFVNPTLSGMLLSV